MIRPSTLGRHAARTTVLLTLIVALAAAGCGSTSPQVQQSGGRSSPVSEEQASSPELDEPSTAQPEDPTAQESAAPGDVGVSIELAGLPVGGGSATLAGDSWCQILSWRTQLPQSVRLDIDAVTNLEPGATLEADGCDQLPPCLRSVITGDSPSCAVLIRPPSPQTPRLTVRLDGTLRCPDQTTCDAVGATGGDTFSIDNPGGGETTDGVTDTDAGTDDSSAEQTPPASDAAQDGSATPASTP